MEKVRVTRAVLQADNEENYLFWIYNMNMQ